MKTLRIIGIIVGLLLLILIRSKESYLFYDPLLSFFKKTYFTRKAVPDFDFWKLILSLGFRFFLNSVISLIIIQLWFRDLKITKLSLFCFLGVFIIFLFLYFLSLYTNFGLGYMPTFYIRRFLIQPIVLLILIPAIYYYLHIKK